jgi:hypothetical protein
MKPNLTGVLRILLKYGIRCKVSLEELLTYLEAPSYEDDTIKLKEILGDELLLLHEVAEICFLKKMGYTITSNIIVEAYPQTYKAHLKALEIELETAKKLERYDWITRRCEDLKSYLEDPNLPSRLNALVFELISRYCPSNTA